MQCIKGPQWLMGFSKCEQRRKNRIMLSDVTQLMSVMSHRVNVYQLYPDLYPLPRNCEKWRSQPSHTITSRMTNPTPHARTHTHKHTHFICLLQRLKYNCNMPVGSYANLDGSCSQEISTAKSNKLT